MIPRRVLFAVALVAGVGAGTIFLAANQRTSVVVAARDLDGARPLEPGDIELRGFPSEIAPLGALRDPGLVVGRSIRGPIARGQVLVSGWLADHAAIFQSGLLPPDGTRALGLPVASAHALGGAVVPGSTVDVIAVPVAGRAPAGQRAEVLVAAALVLDVRSESGAPYARATGRPGVGAISDRLGSVVVAVPAAVQLRVAERIPTSTFVLVLARAR